MSDLAPSERNEGGAVCKACAQGLFGDDWKTVDPEKNLYLHVFMTMFAGFYHFFSWKKCDEKMAL
jgi:hypothetical protein